MSLAKIAANLGISITTVSRALGGFSDVAATTRARIEAEAARLNYHPNENARRLRRGRADAIGLVVPTSPGDFADPFFLRMLAAIGPALAQANLDLLVTTARPGAEEMRAYRKMVETRKVDGLFVARTRRRDDRIAYLLDQNMPFVAHGRANEPRVFAWLDIDGEAACRAATERLIGLGHRRIGMINAPTLYSFAHHREAGWHAALWDAQLPPGPLAHVEPSEESGFLAAKAMLADPAPPTAILCAPDRLAVGCLHALADAGLRAGGDISVIGFDNLPVATYTDPPLTTIAQPIERAAARMVEMLLARIAGTPADGMQELWQAELIQRASDGPARAAAASASPGGNTTNEPQNAPRP